MEQIHTFAEDGAYLSSSERPRDPVTGKPAEINKMIATDKPLPLFNYETQLPYFDREKEIWIVKESTSFLENKLKEIEYLKQDVIEEVRKYRISLESQGVNVNGLLIPISLGLYLKLQSLLSTAGIDQKSIYVKIFNKWHNFTAEEISTYMDVISMTLYRYDNVQREHEEAIAEIVSIEALREYNVTLNW